MRCRRIALEADIVKYEVGKNLEDGKELWVKIVIQEGLVTDSLVKLKKDDGTIVCPYINTRRGRVFIEKGDYIIIDADGSKHICGEDKIWKRYEKIDAENEE